MVARKSRNRDDSTPPPEEDEEEQSQRRKAPAGRRADKDAPVELANPKKSLQHLFLQCLVSRRSMPDDLAKAVYAQCAKTCGVKDPQSLQDFAGEMNQDNLLGRLGLDLNYMIDAEKNTAMWSLINTVNDDVARFATEYKPQELAFFRLVIGKIMTAGNMSYSVRYGEALRCVLDESVNPKISMHKAQDLVRSLIARGWLNLNKNKYITLSGRALAELSTYLKDTFEDADDEDDEMDSRYYVECAHCRFLVTVGYACPSRHCGVRLHKACVSHFVDKHGKCPGEDANDPCGHVWTSNGSKSFVGTPVGEDNGDDDGGADFSDLDDEPAKKKAGKKAPALKAAPSKAGKGKKKGNDSDDEEDAEMEVEEEDDEEEEEAQLSDADSTVATLSKALSQAQTGSKKRGGARGAAKAKPRYAGDDEDEEMSE